MASASPHVTQTGMQQKAGTNMEGPAPVESAPAASAVAASPWAKLSSAGLAGVTIKGSAPVKKTETPAAVDSSSSSSSSSSTDSVTLNPTALTTLPDAPSLSCVVLDSGAFISSGSVALSGTSAGFEMLARIYRESNGRTRFVTTTAVLAELKDAKTREMMQALPFQIEVGQIDPAAIKEVYRFATLTGDAKVLSATDIQVIALQYQLEKSANGMRFLQVEPKRTKAMDAIDAAKNAAHQGVKVVEVTTSASTEKPAEAAAPDAAEASPVAADASSGATSNAQEGVEHEELEEDDEEDAPEETQAAPTTAEEESKESRPPAATASSATEEKDTDGGDGEGVWITPSNIHQHQRAPAPVPSAPESTIAVITTDYAMQNVCLQLGLRLLNLRGRSIRSIRSWQKKCHACSALSTDMSREFCSSCGGHTMIRVNVTVNKAGLVRYWHGTRHLNLRGTIYSIPMPRAGRHANNLKLSEDVIDERIRKGGGLYGRTGASDAKLRAQQKTPAQLFDDGVEFGLGKAGPQSNSYEYGYGKKNPNQVRKTGNKKKH